MTDGQAAARGHDTTRHDTTRHDTTRHDPTRHDATRGSFVVFEGGDESGKTTHARWLAEQRQGLFTFEPCADLNLRSLLLDEGRADLCDRAEALLFAADRAQHVETIIQPALQSGRDVICDRYIGSSLAYQSYGRGLDLRAVWSLSEFATQSLLPDVVLLMHIPYETYLERLEASSVDLTRFDSETAEFHRRVIGGYLKLAEADPQRWTVIDGTLPESQVRQAVVEALEAKLKWRL